MSQEIIKRFDTVRNMILESNMNHREKVADKLTELEFFVLDTFKTQRDFVRASLESIREEYRPLRELASGFSNQVTQQVDKVSRQCSNLEKGLR